MTRSIPQAVNVRATTIDACLAGISGRLKASRPQQSTEAAEVCSVRSRHCYRICLYAVSRPVLGALPAAAAHCAAATTLVRFRRPLSDTTALSRLGFIVVHAALGEDPIHNLLVQLPLGSTDAA